MQNCVIFKVAYAAGRKGKPIFTQTLIKLLLDPVLNICGSYQVTEERSGSNYIQSSNPTSVCRYSPFPLFFLQKMSCWERLQLLGSTIKENTTATKTFLHSMRHLLTLSLFYEWPESDNARHCTAPCLSPFLATLTTYYHAFLIYKTWAFPPHKYGY